MRSRKGLGYEDEGMEIIPYRKDKLGEDDSVVRLSETEEGLVATVQDPEGLERLVLLPSKYEVCTRCSGKGKHVNPNVDGHGITAEEWERDWDDESRENYFSGVYDVECYGCGGKRVQLETDWELLSDAWKKILEAYWEDERNYEAMCRSEREYGC